MAISCWRRIFRSVGSTDNRSIISGANRGFSLVVNSKCNVTLKGLTIENGRGTGIKNLGSLHLVSCTVRQNEGSGILNRGVLVMDEVVLKNNHATRGGGLDNWNSATLHNCSILDNVAEAGAGGIMNSTAATLVIDGCCLARNQGLHSNGGALQNLGDATLQNTTLVQNVTTDLSDGGAGKSRVNGGAIWNRGRMTLENCTICQNEADWEGGGICNQGSAILSNSIIANNTSRETPANDCSGSVEFAHRNLIGSLQGYTQTGNIAGVIFDSDPLLGPLGNYGGVTETVILLPGSPAIDAAECGSIGVDARGVKRPAGASCDLGALELEPAATGASTSTSQGQWSDRSEAPPR